MKTDVILAEAWRAKEELGERFAWDPRAICADLMAKQRRPHADLPVVDDLRATLVQHTVRIARLPAPLPTEALMAEDPTLLPKCAASAGNGQKSGNLRP